MKVYRSWALFFAALFGGVFYLEISAAVPLASAPETAPIKNPKCLAMTHQDVLSYERGGTWPHPPRDGVADDEYDRRVRVACDMSHDYEAQFGSGFWVISAKWLNANLTARGEVWRYSEVGSDVDGYAGHNHVEGAGAGMSFQSGGNATVIDNTVTGKDPKFNAEAGKDLDARGNHAVDPSVAPPAPAVQAAHQALNPEQIDLIKSTAAAICNTVTDARGEKTDGQIQTDIRARLRGLLGKLADIGASGGGTLSKEEFQGLTQDATATAMAAAQGCRERVFNKMFDRLGMITPNAVQSNPG